MRVLRARLDWKAGWPLIWVGVVVAVGFGVLAATVLLGVGSWWWLRRPTTTAAACLAVVLFGLACIARGIRCLRSRPPPPPEPPGVPPGRGSP